MKYKFILFAPWLLKSPVPKASGGLGFRVWGFRVRVGLGGFSFRLGV